MLTLSPAVSVREILSEGFRVEYQVTRARVALRSPSVPPPISVSSTQQHVSIGRSSFPLSSPWRGSIPPKARVESRPLLSPSVIQLRSRSILTQSQVLSWQTRRMPHKRLSPVRCDPCLNSSPLTSTDVAAPLAVPRTCADERSVQKKISDPLLSINSFLESFSLSS